VVGGWQVISMVIHSIKGWFTEKGGVRYGYQFAVAVIFALTLLGVIINPILFCVMVVMLFAAPFMAIFYAAICYKEVYVKMQRPLALLK
jgi:small-conductance mechanosensitive channel